MQIVVTSREELQGIIHDAVKAEVSKIAALFRTDEPGMHKGKYLTKRETAQIARVSVRTVENRMKAGVYRYTKESGRKVLIVSEDVYSSLAEGLTDNRFS